MTDPINDHHIDTPTEIRKGLRSIALKSYFIGGLLMFLAVINLWLVVENKFLIKKDIGLAKDEEYYMSRLLKCRNHGDAIQEQNQKLQSDHDKLREAYNSLRLGK